MRMVLSKIAGFFHKNWMYKLIAVATGLVVWVYVLNIVNPYREKKIEDIPIHFQGETELNEAQLVVVNSRNILPAADVVVSARAMQNVNSSLIRTYVDLQNIRAPGTYDLRVWSTSNIGSVIDILPSSVEVEVDWLKTKRIPVQIEFEGELEEGYWKGAASASQEQIIISGSQKIVEQVRKAVCRVPLTGRTEGYYDAMNVVLLDENDQEIDHAGLSEDLPSVIVDMQILPTKTVPIDLADSIVGQQDIPATHQITAITVKPDQIEVAGTESELSKISSLNVKTVNLGSGKESVTENVSIIKPYSDLILITGDTVQVHVEIAEKRSNLNFVNMPIQIRNINSNLETLLISPDQININLTGPNSQMKLIQRDNIKVYIDAKDLTAGTYDLPIQFSIVDEATDVEPKLSRESVSVTLVEKK